MRNNLTEDTFVLLSLGANIGNKIATLDRAVNMLIDEKIITNILKSSYYQTEPYGVKEQDWFVNICVSGITELSPSKLLKKCKEIEKSLGREQRERWHEREIDIDIIFYDNRVVSTANLTIPHIEYKNRNFVLMPASEISGEFVPPDSKYSLKQMVAVCKDKSEVKIIS